MPDRFSSEELRQTVIRLGVAKVARESGVYPQTLYAFAQGRTEHLRSDTRRKVIQAIAKMTGNDLGDVSLEEIISSWDQLTPSQRQVVASMVKSLVDKS